MNANRSTLASMPIIVHVPLQIFVGEICLFLWRWANGWGYRTQPVNLLFWSVLGFICLVPLLIYCRKGWRTWAQIPAFFFTISTVFFVLDSASKGNLGPSFLQNDTSVICSLTIATTLTSLWLDRERFPAKTKATA